MVIYANHELAFCVRRGYLMPEGTQNAARGKKPTAPNPSIPITLPGNECDHYRMSLEHLLSGMSWLRIAVDKQESGQLLPALLQRAAYIYYKLAETHLRADSCAPGRSLRCAILSTYFHSLARYEGSQHEEEGAAAEEESKFSGTAAATEGADSDLVSMALALPAEGPQQQSDNDVMYHLTELAGDAYFFVAQAVAAAATQESGAAAATTPPADHTSGLHQADLLALEAVDADLLDLVRDLGKGNASAAQWGSNIVDVVRAGQEPDRLLLNGSDRDGWHSLGLRWCLGSEAAAIYEQALKVYEKRTQVCRVPLPIPTLPHHHHLSLSIHLSYPLSHTPPLSFPRPCMQSR